MPLTPGDTLNGRYQILSVLGQGGMGFVYHAIDTNLNIEVAIKENLFTTKEYAEQFKQEARLLASLRHPNLPRVTDYFVIEEQGQYLVMDYIEGEDLKERIERQGKISVQEAVIIGLALCDALEYLHSQEPPVVHRDLKPGNVRITPEGRVFLVDFGLAKLGGRDQRTITGAQAVTPGFSPPEQYGSAHTSPLSDIYSLGATLYTALSGEIPPDAFERALDQAELKPLDELNSEVPPALARIIETAMALQPGERFQSAAEMKEALLSLNLVPDQQQHLQDHKWSITPPPGPEGWRSEGEKPEGEPKPNTIPKRLFRTTRRRSKPQEGEGNETQEGVAEIPPPSEPEEAVVESGGHRGALRLLLWALIAAVIAGWYFYSPQTFNAAWQRTSNFGRDKILPGVGALLPGIMPRTATPTPTPTATSTPPPTQTPVVAATTPFPTATPTPSFTPSPTPTVTPSPTSTQAIVMLPTPTKTPPPGPTPTGGSGILAFAANTDEGVQIFQTDLQGKNVRQLTHRDGGACQPRWSPDGQSIAFVAPCQKNTQDYPNAQIYLLHLNTGKTEEITPPGLGDYDPTWSPDGRYIAFTSQRDGYPRIYFINLKTHKTYPLTPEKMNAWQPAWSPDGKQIAFISNQDATGRVWLVDFPPPKDQPSTPEPFSHSKNRINSHPAWTPNGQWIIYGQTDPNVTVPYIVKTPLNNPLLETPLLKVGLAMRDPAVSPDGRWIAFEGWETKNHRIYIMRLDGTSITPITSEKLQAFDPAWKP